MSPSRRTTAPLLERANAAWLEPVRARLGVLQAQGRMPHGLLLTGVPGAGQAEIAAWLAARLLCRADGGRPCGQLRRLPPVPRRQPPGFPLDRRAAGQEGHRHRAVARPVRVPVDAQLPGRRQGFGHRAGRRHEHEGAQRAAQDAGGARERDLPRADGQPRRAHPEDHPEPLHADRDAAAAGRGRARVAVAARGRRRRSGSCLRSRRARPSSPSSTSRAVSGRWKPRCRKQSPRRAKAASISSHLPSIAPEMPRTHGSPGSKAG